MLIRIETKNCQGSINTPTIMPRKKAILCFTFFMGDCRCNVSVFDKVIFNIIPTIKLMTLFKNDGLDNYQ